MKKETVAAGAAGLVGGVVAAHLPLIGAFLAVAAAPLVVPVVAVAAVATGGVVIAHKIKDKQNQPKP